MKATPRTVKIVKKPWGREIWYALSPFYVGKLLELKRGHRLSLQYHRRKTETVYVLAGSLFLEYDGRKARLRPGQAFHIPKGVVHRFGAPYGKVTLLEVSTPEVRDAVRLEDDYGRRVVGSPSSAA